MSEADGFGAITTLMGGGRYNGLVEELGGPSAPGIGFALSIERLLLALETQKVTLPVEEGMDCFIVSIGAEAEKKAAVLLAKLRQAGISADKDYTGKKIKGQLKMADRLQARFSIVLGENELKEGIANVKAMKTGEQEDVPLDQLIEVLTQKLKEEQQ